MWRELQNRGSGRGPSNTTHPSLMDSDLSHKNHDILAQLKPRTREVFFPPFLRRLNKRSNSFKNENLFFLNIAVFPEEILQTPLSYYLIAIQAESPLHRICKKQNEKHSIIKMSLNLPRTKILHSFYHFDEKNITLNWSVGIYIYSYWKHRFLIVRTI